MLTEKLFNYVMEDADMNPGWVPAMDGTDLEKAEVKRSAFNMWSVRSEDGFILSGVYETEEECVEMLVKMRKLTVLFT